MTEHSTLSNLNAEVTLPFQTELYSGIRVFHGQYSQLHRHFVMSSEAEKSVGGSTIRIIVSTNPMLAACNTGNHQLTSNFPKKET